LIPEETVLELRKIAADLNRHRDFVNQNVLKRLEQLEKNVDWISKELERHKNFINDRLVRR